MNEIIRLIFSLTIVCPLSLSGQSIMGKIVDAKQQPIEGATIVLQLPDSTYLGAAISSPDGAFILDKQPINYLLFIQHLSYQTKLINGRTPNTGNIQLELKDNNLDEIVVKGERPLVRVENGRLGYDLAVLSEKQVVNNAYEALAKLPGVLENNGTLSLVGTRNLAIVINGKPTTMNSSQLETFLRNTPVNRVEKAEVIYSAPPDMHVRGAAINLVMKRSNDYSFQGELSANYQNKYFNSGGTNGNFRLSTPKMTFDIMYGANNGKDMQYIDIYSRHTLNDKVYDIAENEQLRSKYWMHNVRAAFEYSFNDKNILNIAYTGSYTPDQYNNSQTKGSFQNGNIDKYVDTHMHNVSVQYTTGFGLDIGGDYTLYTSDNNQKMHTTFESGKKSSFSLIGEQHISRYSIYADEKHNLPQNWTLGYGALFWYARDNDFQKYSYVTGDINTRNTDAITKEHTTNFYASLSKNFDTGTSISISATGEYYSIGNYHKWAVYPQVSLLFLKNQKHIFQLSLSTDKTYPGYWDMQSSVSYLNGYTELHGTPGLRPMNNYNLNGSYILNQKYIFSLFFTHTDDYFTQAPYQSSERLALIYKNTNWDYLRMCGANVLVPFSLSKWYDSRITLVGMQLHQRCDNFYDIPFNRRKWVFVGGLDNTFKIGNNLALELNANVQTPSIQGTFDMNTSFNLTTGMRWSFAKDKCTLTARCTDILNSAMPDMEVRFKGQYLDMNSGYYTRTVSLNFSYRFGGYKKKEVKNVDTSRFGH